jgi:hypothetical protein
MSCALCQTVGPSQIPDSSSAIEQKGTITKGMIIFPGPVSSVLMCTCSSNCGSIFCWRHPNNKPALVLNHYPHEESPVRKEQLTE